MRERAAANTSRGLAARDAAIADAGRCDHIRRHHRCMREEPAVDGSCGFAAKKSAVADVNRCDHIHCHHQCMREALAVDGSRGLAARDAAVVDAGHCGHIGRHHQCMQKGHRQCMREWPAVNSIVIVALLCQMPRWQPQADVITGYAARETAAADAGRCDYTQGLRRCR